MSPERTKKIGNQIVSEYYWAGDYCVYLDHNLQEGETFEQVCDRVAAPVSHDVKQALAAEKGE